jgi:hypothetical protein
MCWNYRGFCRRSLVEVVGTNNHGNKFSFADGKRQEILIEAVFGARPDCGNV